MREIRDCKSKDRQYNDQTEMSQHYNRQLKFVYHEPHSLSELSFFALTSTFFNVLND